MYIIHWAKAKSMLHQPCLHSQSVFLSLGTKLVRSLSYLASFFYTKTQHQSSVSKPRARYCTGVFLRRDQYILDLYP